MRQIGTLPNHLNPSRFADHLTAQGIKNRVDERPDGYVIWIYNEDFLTRAKQELDQFLKDPQDPRYDGARQSAEEVRREERKLDQQYRRNFRDMSGSWDRTNFRRRPLTISLIACSVAVFFAPAFAHSVDVYRLFSFFSFHGNPNTLPHRGLDDILHGQVWRLITPIFLHFGGLHLFFNMWWLLSLGTLIEYRRGTKTLAMLVLAAAIASNVAEYAYELTFQGGPAFFGGMSGVVYALLGYVWMKGRHEPEAGMILNPSTVQIMLIWLVVCFTGYLGPIANTAHVVGLVVGVLFGLARF